MAGTWLPTCACSIPRRLRQHWQAALQSSSWHRPSPGLPLSMPPIRFGLRTFFDTHTHLSVTVCIGNESPRCSPYNHMPSTLDACRCCPKQCKLLGANLAMIRSKPRMSTWTPWPTQPSWKLSFRGLFRCSGIEFYVTHNYQLLCIVAEMMLLQCVCQQAEHHRTGSILGTKYFQLVVGFVSGIRMDGWFRCNYGETNL